MIIYKNKNILITKQNEKYIFKIDEYEKNILFFNTFLREVSERDKITIVSVYADEINTLEYLLKNKEIIKQEYENIFLFLYNQLKILENINLTIPIYNLKDIIYFKIGERYSYYFLNLSKIFRVDMSKQIIIDKIFIKNKFTSKELIDIDEIPNTTLATASYWSLAKIILFCLQHIDITFLDIKYSKLYWALKKCLEKNPKHRYLIFI